MSLHSRIEQHRDRLTAADRRVVSELLAAPSEAVFLSTGEIARRAGVHEASAVRLAKKLGYSGYPALRSALQDELRDRIDPASRVRRQLTEAGGDGVLPALVDDQLRTLAGLVEQVGQAELDAAAKVLVGAETVHLFGYGHATSLVELADRRLRRAGMRTVRLVGDARDLAEHVLALDERDAVLAFALRTEPPALSALLERAGEVGAARIVVTDVLAPLLHPAPELVLAASRGTEDRFQSLVVPMVLLDALVLTAAGLDEDRALQHLSSIEALIDRF